MIDLYFIYKYNIKLIYNILKRSRFNIVVKNIYIQFGYIDY